MEFILSKKKFFFISIIFSMLFLSSCNGSSPAGMPNAESENSMLWKGGALQSLSSVEGIWVQGRCVNITGGSAKNYYKVSLTQSNQANLLSGHLFYSGNSSCSGVASNLGETLIGEVIFLGTDDYGIKKYHYSTLKIITGLVQNYVFALRDNSTICIFNRTDDLVTADQVNSFVSAISTADCYFK